MINKAILITVIFPIILSAEDNPINNFIIGFWPEYDHPGVLVSLQIQTDTTKIPFKFNLRVPEYAKMAVETLIESGEQISNPVELIQINNEYYLPINLIDKNYYAQFYFNPFTENENRIMKFYLQADINLLDYYIVIQKHISGSDFTTNLENVKSITDEFGLTYYRSNNSLLPSGESQLIKIEYNNPENITTMTVLNSILTEMEHNHEMTENNPGILENHNKNKSNVMTISIAMTMVILFYAFLLHKKSAIVTNKIYCSTCGIMLDVSNQYCKECGGKIVS